VGTEAATLVQPPATIRRELPEWAEQAWEGLFDMVRQFRPDVVVLTARKMPRICEGLRVDFGSQVLVISDLAVPFSSAYLSGARVAIVDDVVNLGSTLEQVAGMVEKYYPAAVRLFSLSKRTLTDVSARREIAYAHPVALDEREYAAYVRTVPAAISHVCKPYDLAFPVLRVQYRMPLRSSADIVESLIQAFDRQAVQVIPSPYVNSPIRRVSLLLSETSLAPRKLRLYFDDTTGTCSLVPMIIPNHVDEANMPLALSWVAAIREGLKRVLADRQDIDNREAVAAVALFTSSLDWFWSSDLHVKTNFFFEFGQDRFSVADAKIVFGPRIESISIEESKSEFTDNRQSARSDTDGSDAESPFLGKFDLEGLIRLSVERLKKTGVLINDLSIDCYSYLLCIVDALSELVGTENPSAYELTWPYPKERIAQNVYLRLRIGPTFSDIVTICRRIHQSLTKSTAMPPEFTGVLSVTLDALIDQGAIVPTFANYDGQVFRIYRRGEAPGQDSVDTVNFAFAAYSKPLTITRLAKMLSTLSHSQKYHRLLESSARQRGLVAGAPKSALGSEPENIATYLRNTGQIRPVET
jgi:hypothetical protein